MSILDQVLSGFYKPNKQERPTVTSGAVKTSGATASSHATPSQGVSSQAMPSQGELFRGEVIDLRLNQISVLLKNGALVSARTEGDLPLVIGQKASFFIAQTTDSQITLKLAKEEGSSENKIIDKALQAAGLQKNERTVTIVSTLLEHQQPVNETSIRHYMMLSAKYPDLPIKDFVLMELHKLPVTQDSVSQMMQYHEGTHQLITQADTALNELWKQLSTLPEGSVRDSLLSQLRTLLPSDQSAASHTAFLATNNNTAKANAEPYLESNTLAAPTLEGTMTSPEMIPASTNTLTLTNNATTLPDGMQTPHDTNATLFNSNSTLPDGSNESQALQQKTLSSVDDTIFDSLEEFKKAFLQNFLLKPEQLSEKDAVSNYYKRLEEQVTALHQLSEKLSETTSSGHAVPAAKQMQSNLSFMDMVNQVFPYVQLPLLLKDKPAHGELYVYERKKNLSKSESLSALLHLDLESLGTTDIFVTLHGTSVSAKFYLADDAAKRLITTELPQLSDALQAKGYVLQTEVTIREAKQENDSLMEQFLEDHSPSGLHRYTFDIRA